MKFKELKNSVEKLHEKYLREIIGGDVYLAMEILKAVGDAPTAMEEIGLHFDSYLDVIDAVQEGGAMYSHDRKFYDMGAFETEAEYFVFDGQALYSLGKNQVSAYLAEEIQQTPNLNFELCKTLLYKLIHSANESAQLLFAEWHKEYGKEENETI